MHHAIFSLRMAFPLFFQCCSAWFFHEPNLLQDHIKLMNTFVRTTFEFCIGIPNHLVLNNTTPPFRLIFHFLHQNSIIPCVPPTLLALSSNLPPTPRLYSTAASPFPCSCFRFGHVETLVMREHHTKLTMNHTFPLPCLIMTMNHVAPPPPPPPTHTFAVHPGPSLHNCCHRCLRLHPSATCAVLQPPRPADPLLTEFNSQVRCFPGDRRPSDRLAANYVQS